MGEGGVEGGVGWKAEVSLWQAQNTSPKRELDLDITEMY